MNTSLLRPGEERKQLLGAWEAAKQLPDSDPSKKATMKKAHQAMLAFNARIQAAKEKKVKAESQGVL
jgi:hypothetical protein